MLFTAVRNVLYLDNWTENPLVHYRGTDKWFCIVDSYVEVKQYKGKKLLRFRGNISYTNAL
jgi:hypothetical protein